MLFFIDTTNHIFMDCSR